MIVEVWVKFLMTKRLTLNLSNIVRKDEILEDMHINFMVYNKAVLMVGEAPSDEARRLPRKTNKEESTKNKSTH